MYYCSVKVTVTLCILASLFLGCKSKNTSQGQALKIEITSTSDYCGGAVPNEEIMAALNEPKPYEGSIYIHTKPDRSDDGQKLEFANGKVNQAGFVEGVYFIFLIPKFDKKESTKNKMDEEMQECMEMYSAQNVGQFIVTKETKDVYLNVHQICNPCLPPMP